MELKEGMYVRTKLGIIAKCTNILEDCSYDFDRIVYQDNYNEDGFMEIPYLLIDKYIIKSSYNIIDLIEEGDYVNGLKITYIDEPDEYISQKLLYFEYPIDYVIKTFCNEDIKSIVTKEQFKNMEYIVGGNNEN